MKSITGLLSAIIASTMMPTDIERPSITDLDPQHPYREQRSISLEERKRRRKLKAIARASKKRNRK